MKFKTLALLPLAVCALWSSAANANYFSNHRMNVYRNVGSAPNPTQEQVRMNFVPILSASGAPLTVRQAGVQAANRRTAQIR